MHEMLKIHTLIIDVFSNILTLRAQTLANTIQVLRFK